MISFWMSLGNLWANIIQWLWIILALAAVVCFLISAFASLIPFAWLKSYSNGALVVGIVLTAVSSNIQGAARTGAEARLKETQAELLRVQSINLGQKIFIEQQAAAFKAADDANVQMKTDLAELDEKLTTETAKLKALEGTDNDVANYLTEPVPRAVGCMLVPSDC